MCWPIQQPFSRPSHYLTLIQRLKKLNSLFPRLFLKMEELDDAVVVSELSEDLLRASGKPIHLESLSLT